MKRWCSTIYRHLKRFLLIGANFEISKQNRSFFLQKIVSLHTVFSSFFLYLHRPLSLCLCLSMSSLSTSLSVSFYFLCLCLLVPPTECFFVIKCLLLSTSMSHCIYISLCVCPSANVSLCPCFHLSLSVVLSLFPSSFSLNI